MVTGQVVHAPNWKLEPIHEYVPPPVANMLVQLPWHILDGVELIVGTVTVTVFELGHEELAFPFTVYVVVTVG